MADLTLTQRVNDFAIRSFRDIADGDYIAARFACRVGLLPQYLWASQQAIEKYLKCILLLHRIPAADVKHDLSRALELINASSYGPLELSEPTREFIEYIDARGRYRYLEASHWGQGKDIIKLDRAVWELRQRCRLGGPSPEKVIEGVIPSKIRLQGGYLEQVMDVKPKYRHHTEARAALLWQNGFFGLRRRRILSVGGWVTATNAPLTLSPEILDEVLKYIYLPKDVRSAYREHAAKRRKAGSK